MRLKRPEQLEVAVSTALQKLEENQNPDRLTLEELMMCYYYRPCRRVTPGTNRRYGRYARGSILVYEKEVVLILMPDDDTTYFPATRHRTIGPKRKYRGILPGSTFYTNGHVMVRVEEPFERVTKGREAEAYIRQRAEEGHPMESIFAENSRGKLNDHRCVEAFGLAGERDAKRYMKALKEIFRRD